MAFPRGERILLRGNEAIAQAALDAGCRAFFGYPITPQNQVPEYLSKRMPEVGGVFLQAESEVAAINMVYGAAAAGARVMTASSSPGHQPEAGGHLLPRRGRAALRHRQHHARRPGPGQHRALPVRLLPGHPRRRPRRLPHHRAGALVGAGDGRPDAGGLRPGRPVPQPRC